MIGQTFTRTGRPKLVFRIVWRGSLNGIDCIRGVTLDGKFQTLTRLTEVVFVSKTAYDPAIDAPAISFGNPELSAAT
jgi:hypothetical protein